MLIRFPEVYRLRHPHRVFTRLAGPATRLLAGIVLAGALGWPSSAPGQSADQATVIHYDSATKVFRLDGADVSYVLGINERSEVQTLYWGKRLASSDTLAEAKSSDPISGLSVAGD